MTTFSPRKTNKPRHLSEIGEGNETPNNVHGVTLS